MTISRLDTPLRVTWDLHGADGALPVAAALKVARELVDAGVFYVTLPGRPLAHPGIAAILELLREGQMQIQLIYSGSAEEEQNLQAVRPLPELFLDLTSFLQIGSKEEWTKLENEVERLRRQEVEPGLVMVPDRQRLPLLLPLLAFARKSGVKRIKLPNTPVDANFPEKTASLLPDAADLAALALKVTDPRSLRAGLILDVHDLFLWEIFFPGERTTGRAEYGGCQAANSLAHIDALGTVHPCSSWPQRLGSLLECSFVEIWQSEARGAVLDKIAAVPPGCNGCSDYAICFGGCRGLVETLGSADQGRDLLCAGIRSESEGELKK